MICMWTQTAVRFSIWANKQVYKSFSTNYLTDGMNENMLLLFS